VQAELIAMRQEDLRVIQEKKARAIELNPPNDGFDGTPPPAS
jgi:hypothetical protein